MWTIVACGGRDIGSEGLEAGIVVWGRIVWIVVLVLTFAICLWGTISPRSQWRVLSGWLYRSGSAPSDFHYGWLWLRNAVGAVASAVLVVVFVKILLRDNL